jgi:hypothetical protein
MCHPRLTLSSQCNPPKEIFGSEDDLLDSLQQEYKFTKGILDFDAAYTMPEQGDDPISIEKHDMNDENISEALFKCIWNVTRRRWTCVSLLTFV